MGLDVVSMYVCVFLLVVADVGSRWHGGGSVLLCFFGGFFNGLLCASVVLAWLCHGWHGGGYYGCGGNCWPMAGGFVGM